MDDKFATIKNEIQLIIDAMAMKNSPEASSKLVEVNDVLDNLIDTTNEEIVLREISKYQVLLNHLQIKMSTSS